MAPKKKGAYSMAPVIPAGLEFTDQMKQTWKLGKDFAKGGFGRIYTVTKIDGKLAGPKKGVVKVEPFDNGPLFQEIHVFQRIAKPEMLDAFKKSQKIKFLGVPSYLGCGSLMHKQAKQRFLIMPQFGASIESVRLELEPADVFRLSLATVDALHYLHSVNYVHADVKAENLLFADSASGGNHDFSRVVLVDFGLAKKLTDSPEFNPNPKKAHDGTLIFTSLDAHEGCNPSYRGDIEILAYNIVYWLSGDLPWSKFENAPTKVHADKRLFKTNVAKIVKSLLDEPFAPDVVELLKYAYDLDYSQKPDYTVVRGLLNGALKKAARGKKRRQSRSPVKKKVLPVNKRGGKSAALSKSDFDSDEEGDESGGDESDSEETTTSSSPIKRSGRASVKQDIASSSAGSSSGRAAAAAAAEKRHALSRSPVKKKLSPANKRGGKSSPLSSTPLQNDSNENSDSETNSSLVKTAKQQAVKDERTEGPRKRKTPERSAGGSKAKAKSGASRNSSSASAQSIINDSSSQNSASRARHSPSVTASSRPVRKAARRPIIIDDSLTDEGEDSEDDDSFTGVGEHDDSGDEDGDYKDDSRFAASTNHQKEDNAELGDDSIPSLTRTNSSSALEDSITQAILQSAKKTRPLISSPKAAAAAAADSPRPSTSRRLNRFQAKKGVPRFGSKQTDWQYCGDSSRDADVFPDHESSSVFKVKPKTNDTSMKSPKSLKCKSGARIIPGLANMSDLNKSPLSAAECAAIVPGASKVNMLTMKTNDGDQNICNDNSSLTNSKNNGRATTPPVRSRRRLKPPMVEMNTQTSPNLW